jgi:hypothetical protein
MTYHTCTFQFKKLLSTVSYASFTQTICQNKIIFYTVLLFSFFCRCKFLRFCLQNRYTCNNLRFKFLRFYKLLNDKKLTSASFYRALFKRYLQNNKNIKIAQDLQPQHNSSYLFKWHWYDPIIIYSPVKSGLLYFKRP